MSRRRSTEGSARVTAAELARWRTWVRLERDAGYEVRVGNSGRVVGGEPPRSACDLAHGCESPPLTATVRRHPLRLRSEASPRRGTWSWVKVGGLAVTVGGRILGHAWCASPFLALSTIRLDASRSRRSSRGQPKWRAAFRCHLRLSFSGCRSGVRSVLVTMLATAHGDRSRSRKRGHRHRGGLTSTLNVPPRSAGVAVRLGPTSTSSRAASRRVVVRGGSDGQG